MRGADRIGEKRLKVNLSQIPFVRYSTRTNGEFANANGA